MAVKGPAQGGQEVGEGSSSHGGGVSGIWIGRPGDGRGWRP